MNKRSAQKDATWTASGLCLAASDSGSKSGGSLRDREEIAGGGMYLPTKRTSTCTVFVLLREYMARS